MAVPAIAAAAKAIAAAAGRAAAAGAAKKAGGGSWFGFLAVLAALVVAIVGAPAMLVGAAIITAAAAGGSAGSDLSPPDGDEDGSPQWLDEMMPICAGARLRDVDEVNGTTPGGTWDAEQLENARTITEVAMTLDWRAFYAVPSRPFPPGEGELWPSVTEAPAVPMQVLVTAMITAMQESSLRNLDHDDDAINPDGTIADGGGLFQQQPSQGWGTWDQITDPAWSTARFMLGVADLGDRSILGSVEWAKATPPEIAHAVQGNQSVDDYVPWWENGDAELLISRFLDTEDCLGGMELPLPGQYTWTSGYGPRNTGIPGASTWHPAWDFANGCNVPIYAIRPGSVTTINGAANTLGITDRRQGRRSNICICTGC
ncbi:M23 family metallopeptidase [Microbacterium amylolyticum]|uniref:M23 family metallopeptidase n=1 Tax=Microbacterium amylolyticum TaxID=936337 RepID=UPI00361ECA6C